MLLDLVPRALVTVTVPDDLRALREAVKVVASTHNGTSDNGDDGKGLGGDVLLDLGEDRLSWSDICENKTESGKRGDRGVVSNSEGEREKLQVEQVEVVAKVEEVDVWRWQWTLTIVARFYFYFYTSTRESGECGG